MGALATAKVMKSLPEIALSVVSASRRYGSVIALDGIDLDVRKGEMLTLLGPSGSGKTTLLKVIAGFEVPDEGEILIDTKNVTLTPPSKREIGMVFQNYALFPHLTVSQNVAFPLQMRKISKFDIAARVSQILSMVDLAGYGERLPRQLSGGQQQRVALARAIVFGPNLLLLDEPFGALDRKLREQMQLEVRRLQQKLGLTAVFVTHDQEEALILSDRIAVMDAGKISQLDTPQAIYHRPANRFVADFIGESNLFRATVIAGGYAELENGINVKLSSEIPSTGTVIGLVIRPERLRQAEQGSIESKINGLITEIVFLGETIKYRIRDELGFEVLVRWPFLSNEKTLQLGEQVSISWNHEDMHLVKWL